MNDKKYPEVSFFGFFLIILSIVAFFISKKTGTLDSNNQYNSVFILVFVFIRFLIIFWILNIAKYLNRNQIFWGIFAFIFPSLSLIIIGQLKGIKTNSIISRNENQESQLSFEDQRKILLDLKQNDILSDIEYLEKTNKLSESEKKLTEINENIAIEKKVEELIKPYVIKLEELLKLNLLTNEEFDQKKKILIEKQTEKIQEEKLIQNEYNNKYFDKISRKDLYAVEILGITRLEEKIKIGDKILKSKLTKLITLYSKDEIQKIIDNGENDNFYLIEN